MSFYYTYVLQSTKDSTLYVGWTDELKDRVKTHNDGKVSSTKLKIPYNLIYFEGCRTKKLAILREKQLKTGFGRAYLNRRLSLKVK